MFGWFSLVASFVWVPPILSSIELPACCRARKRTGAALQPLAVSCLNMASCQWFGAPFPKKTLETT